MKPITVRTEWDNEAQLWVAVSDDVARLATEHHAFDALVEKLKVMIPELLKANGQQLVEGTQIPFHVFSECDSMTIAV
ncbi:MAG: DUF1902 domain-containing protein [Pseudomonadota bacterium]